MLKEGAGVLRRQRGRTAGVEGSVLEDVSFLEELPMPRTRSLAWAELKIGLVSIFAIVMATLLIFLLSGSGGFFWQRYSLKTMFSNIAGLEGRGARARRRGGGGFGQRGELHRRPGRGRHGGEQGSSGAHHVHVSLPTLGSVSLLGEAAVDITAASGGTSDP